MANHQIFISYARKNREQVVKIYQRLQTEGFALWRDLSELTPGEGWWEQIKEAIDHSETLILCLSLEALASVNVEDEWKYARQQGKRIIPVIVNEVFKHPEVQSGKVKLTRWMKETDCLDLRDDIPEAHLQWERLLKTLQTPHVLKRRPMMLPVSAGQMYVERANEEQKVKAALILDEHAAQAPVVALVGAGGYGKTMLAHTVARALSDEYDDGILGITLGETAGESLILGKLLDLIEVITARRPSFTNLDTASAELARVIGDSRVLLVIDDVWDAAQLAPFLALGKHCAKLITTRNERLLPVGTIKHRIDQMSHDDGLVLLCNHLPAEEMQTHHAAMLDLARRLGYWAQMLAIVNGVLRIQHESGATIDAALAYVFDGFDEEGFDAFDNPDSESMRHRTARAVIEVSLRLLTEPERQNFEQLAVFPADIDIPLATVATLWGSSLFKTQKLCEIFFSRLALLQIYDLERMVIRLHMVIRDDLLRQLRDQLPHWHGRLLDHPDWQYVYELPTDYAWTYYAYHLDGAGRLQQLKPLLLDFVWLQKKLPHAHTNALIDDFDYLQSDQDMLLIQSALRMSAHVLNMDPTALATQLSSRLWVYQHRAPIGQLLQTITPPTQALFPSEARRNIHNPANSVLERTITGHSKHLGGTILLTYDRFLVWDANHVLYVWDLKGNLLGLFSHPHARISGAIQLSEEYFVTWYMELVIQRDQQGNMLPVQTGNMFLRKWSISGEFIELWEGHKSIIKGCIRLSNGHVLSWDFAGQIIEWDSTGNILHQLLEHSAAVNGVVELNNHELLSWSDDKTLLIWNASREGTQPLSIHEKAVHGVLQLHDGLFVSWDTGGTCHLWTAQGELLQTIQATTPVLGMLEMTDGNILMWCLKPRGTAAIQFDSDETTFECYTREGQLVFALKQSGRVAGAILLPNQDILFWLLNDPGMKILGQQGKTVQSLKAYTSTVGGVIKLTNGKYLSWSRDVVTGDRSLRIWNFEQLDQLVETADHKQGLNGLLKLDHQRLLSWGGKPSLITWEKTGKRLGGEDSSDLVLSHVKKLDNGDLIMWGADRVLRWLTKDNHMSTLTPLPRPIEGLFEYNNQIIVWCGNFLQRNYQFFFWDLPAQKAGQLPGFPPYLDGARALKNGSWLVWSSTLADSLFVFSQTAPPVNLKAHPMGTWGTKELSDGGIVSWDSLGTMQFWDANYQPQRQIRPYNFYIYGVLEKGDGTLIVYAYQPVMKHFTRSGEEMGAFIGHQSEIHGGHLIANNRLISWSADATIKVWDTETYRCLHTFWLDYPVKQLVYFEEDGRVAAAMQSGQVIFLEWYE